MKIELKKLYLEGKHPFLLSLTKAHLFFPFFIKRRIEPAHEQYTHLSFISSEGRSNSLDIPSLVSAENTCPLSTQASSSDLSMPFHIMHSRMSVSNCISSLSPPCKRKGIFTALQLLQIFTVSPSS